LRKRLGGSAAGTEELFALIGDDHFRPFARSKMRFELIGEMMEIDDRRTHVSRRQAIEHMVDQGPAHDLDQRLRPAIGERPHARAEARREHDRGLGHGM
jgi:hypothetical protein